MRTCRTGRPPVLVPKRFPPCQSARFLSPLPFPKPPKQSTAACCCHGNASLSQIAACRWWAFHSNQGLFRFLMEGAAPGKRLAALAKDSEQEGTSQKGAPSHSLRSLALQGFFFFFGAEGGVQCVSRGRWNLSFYTLSPPPPILSQLPNFPTSFPPQFASY